MNHALPKGLGAIKQTLQLGVILATVIIWNVLYVHAVHWRDWDNSPFLKLPEVESFFILILPAAIVLLSTLFLNREKHWAAQHPFGFATVRLLRVSPILTLVFSFCAGSAFQ